MEKSGGILIKERSVAVAKAVVHFLRQTQLPWWFTDVSIAGDGQ